MCPAGGRTPLPTVGTEGGWQSADPGQPSSVEVAGLLALSTKPSAATATAAPHTALVAARGMIIGGDGYCGWATVLRAWAGGWARGVAGEWWVPPGRPCRAGGGWRWLMPAAVCCANQPCSGPLPTCRLVHLPPCPLATLPPSPLHVTVCASEWGGCSACATYCGGLQPAACGLRLASYLLLALGALHHPNHHLPIPLFKSIPASLPGYPPARTLIPSPPAAPSRRREVSGKHIDLQVEDSLYSLARHSRWVGLGAP